jgi:transcriptional regulator with XRE-family HTH domain
VDNRELGHRLRALRTAAGRTVASVAADAGLSVPYVANLENGRGNPTTTALTRLAAALGTELTITFGGEGGQEASAPPNSLVRLGRTARFRRDVRLLADRLGQPAEDLAPQLIRALAQTAGALSGDLAEADWWRLLDALLLVGLHPSG